MLTLLFPSEKINLNLSIKSELFLNLNLRRPLYNVTFSKRDSYSQYLGQRRGRWRNIGPAVGRHNFPACLLLACLLACCLLALIPAPT